MDEEKMFQYGSYILFPLFIIYPSISSEMFLFYLLLAILKIKKEGYKKSGLELYIALAVLGLGISYIGNWDIKILKDTFAVFKILILPLFIYQFRPIENLEKKLLYMFNTLGIYGILEFFILKSKFLKNDPSRLYSYLKFVMDSSVIALTGYIYCILYLIVKEKKTAIEKICGVGGTLIFSYLILLHQVRAAYLSYGIVSFLIAFYIFVTLDRKKKTIIILMIICFTGLAFNKAENFLKIENVYINKINSIADTKKNQSNTARLHYWKTAVETFKKTPVKGIGYKKFNMDNIEVEERYKHTFYHAHSEFFSMLAEVGFIGSILWYFFKIKIFQIFYFRRKKLLGLFLIITFIGFEIQTFFEVYLVAKNVYRYLFLLIGFILVHLKENQREMVANAR